MMAHWPYIFLLYLLPCKQQTTTDRIVKVTAPEVTAYPGKSGALYIYVEVKKGYHIQANKVNDEFIVPTTLEINADGIITTGKHSFPPGKKFRLEGTSDYLLVYDGVFKIVTSFKTPETIQQGNYTLGAKLHYQACDAKTCFSPKTVTFSVSVKII
jgi:hypothetical protein